MCCDGMDVDNQNIYSMLGGKFHYKGHAKKKTPAETLGPITVDSMKVIFLGPFLIK